MSVLWFFIGLWLGGIVGIFTMCMFQISGKCAEKEDSERYFNNEVGKEDCK